MSWEQAEGDRRQAGLVRLATVVEVDPGSARVRVSFGGESKSAFIPFMAQRAGGAVVWSPPVVGEQVVVASPNGDTAQGVVLGSIFQGGFPAPSADGGAFEVHLGASKIVITDASVLVSSNGSSILLDASGVKINGARVELN